MRDPAHGELINYDNFLFHFLLYLPNCVRHYDYDVITICIVQLPAKIFYIGCVWIEFIIAENWKLKIENTVVK